VEFNLKFFFVATVLTVALTLANTTVWIHYFGPSDFQTSIYFLFQPLQLVLSVFLPFAVMYTMSLKTPQVARLRPILVSTFFGCWLGGLINTAIQFLVAVQFSSWANVNLLLTIYELCWLIAIAAFSGILFVSLAAIMLAYYRAHRKITDY
jgi:hypothetical protein